MIYSSMNAQDNAMHCIAKGSIAHNFLRLKEGSIYSVKNFTVMPNKDEFRVIRFADFMLEFDGETTVRKAFCKSDGFTRYSFQLVKIDKLEPTNNKYLIDRLYLSSTSSTLIVDDEKILLLMWLKTDDRYRLELEISDKTEKIVVVMFDETTRVLLKCSASSTLECEGHAYFYAPFHFRNTFTDLHLQDEDASLGLPTALANIVGTSHTLELKSHTYYEHGVNKNNV
nr:hypothetical protein [Tanacetum cinerariifolium]